MKITLIAMLAGAQGLVCRFGSNVVAKRGVVRMMMTAESKMVEITANNLQMTDGMRGHVQEKVGAVVDRYSNIITRAETHLTVNRNPRVKHEADCAEVVVFTKNNVVVRSEERTSNMYASIDLVAHKLSRKLRKLKERKEQRKHKRDSFRTNPDELEPSSPLPSALEEAPTVPLESEQSSLTTDDLIPPLDPSLTEDKLVRRKKFAMPTQTLEEAMEAIEYVGHDFYIFTNAITGKLNVLYKRREGGLGLIEPDEAE